MVWFSALKLGLNAATHIYKKKQETKMAMADAQHMHASKMARGESEYQGKLLEARQSDWKDEFVLVVLTLPILVIAYGVFSEDPAASEKIKEFFDDTLVRLTGITNKEAAITRLISEEKSIVIDLATQIYDLENQEQYTNIFRSDTFPFVDVPRIIDTHFQILW